MSRKITREVCDAFESGYKFCKGNSSVGLDSTGRVNTMMLHGNVIAKYEDGELYITNAGWSSNTTKERLNGLRGVSIKQKDFQWYLNGRTWNGAWVRVSSYQSLT